MPSKFFTKRRARGQSVVEFALAVPIIVLLLAGAVDMGNAFQTWINLTNASREGARKASSTADTATICTYINDEMANTGISVACSSPNFVMTYPGAGGPDAGTCTANLRKAGCPVRVKVSYAMTTLLGQVLGFNTLTINAYTDMMVFTE